VSEHTRLEPIPGQKGRYRLIDMPEEEGEEATPLPSLRVLG
jgi:hypothetical protein